MGSVHTLHNFFFSSFTSGWYRQWRIIIITFALWGFNRVSIISSIDRRLAFVDCFCFNIGRSSFNNLVQSASLVFDLDAKIIGANAFCKNELSSDYFIRLMMIIIIIISDNAQNRPLVHGSSMDRMMLLFWLRSFWFLQVAGVCREPF